MFSNARGIKSKLISLKQILIKNPCEIIALYETHFNQNLKVNVPGYKWIGLSRKDKDGAGIVFLINNNIVKPCFVEPQTNDRIEIMAIRPELKHNKTIIICSYYWKQETKTTKQEAKLDFDYLSQHITYRVTTTYYYLEI